MFERTRTFWYRLLGRTASVLGPTHAAVQEADDRRVWVRYPAEVEASYQPAGDATRLSARVRNPCTWGTTGTR